MESRLTEAARRALRLAARLARQQGAPQVEPLHLLWALRLDESRAAEILDEQGLSQFALEEHLPLRRRDENREDSALTPEIVESQAFRNVVREAQRQAGLAGRHAEVGSEHLLYGLSIVESAVNPLLNDYGLSGDQIERRISVQCGAASEPIGVDVRLSSTGRPQHEQTDACRIADAAANRLREGLRVVEDYVRFVLDDAHLTRLLKECRHELADALRAAGASGWIASRDTTRDVGTQVSTPAERVRRSPRDLVVAGLKRLQEGARTLEEFGKLISPELGERIKQLRYRFYTLEKVLLVTEASQRRFEGRELYLLVTETGCTRGLEAVVCGAIRGGAGVIQVREKSMSDRQLSEHARRVRGWTREAGALLIMNDRPDLAVLCDADGVHVGQDELPVREARRIVGPDRLVGVSTHTIEQARQAMVDGADYVGVGPVFPSDTKSFDEPAGLEFVRQVAAEISLPWFAIGGIGGSNVAAVREAGATRIAVGNAICAADDPEQAARELLQSLKG